MKTIVIAALAALAITTGFTCSKNQPAADQAAPTQEQMAAPTEGAPADATAPTEAAPAEGTTAPTEEVK